jgi:hypothetical protein
MLFVVAQPVVTKNKIKRILLAFKIKCFLSMVIAYSYDDEKKRTNCY